MAWLVGEDARKVARAAADFSLLRSEVRKVEKVANERNGCSDCHVTGWFFRGFDELGFADVRCEVCRDWAERVDDVEIHVCGWDRRHSFVSKEVC